MTAGPPVSAGADMAWFADPVELALKGSRGRRDAGRGAELPSTFCLEVGRRLLLAHLEFSQWILRRVEKVQFERERSVSRHISIDFVVREDAPVFAGHEGDAYLVPVSVMRRRTLVNFALTDESGERLPMLGLRLTQRLDQSMLLAAAEAHKSGSSRDPALREFVQKAVAGTAEEVDAAVDQFDDPSAEGVPAAVRAAHESELFRAAFRRLHRNFTLYVLLKTDQPRHRVLTLSFDEPTRWVLQRPALERSADDGDVWTYDPMQKVNRVRGLLVSMSTHLGLRSTRIRFQIPAAEHATSFHFEATAPLGVRIVEASLLAGRPNDTDHPVSVDRIIGHTPSVGLHAVEIPNVSLCRVQLKLRVPLHGWLTTLTVSCLAIAAILWVVSWQWPLVVLGEPVHRRVAPGWSENQVTNVVVLLVTVSASAAGLIAHREFGGLAASMVARLRAVGVCTLALPIVASVALVYAGQSPWRNSAGALGHLLWALTALACVASLLTLTAAFFSWLTEKRSPIASPWDMTLNKKKPGLASKTRARVRSDTFAHAMRDLRFRAPAIGVASSEGFHSHYDWTDRKQKEAVAQLNQGAAPPSYACGLIDECAQWRSCPASGRVRRNGSSGVHQSAARPHED